ncbi:MAG TPA: response regulator transcription factor [Clostridiales bacterium]|nr:response regulator transcription factor [Clostridiales bacterium]
MDNKIKVLIVEDDDDFAFLVRQHIAKETDMECVGVAANPNDAIRLSCKLLPHIVLMDLNLSISDLDGVETAKNIRIQSGAKIIILTSLESVKIVEYAVKKAFASDYLFKSQFSILCDTIRQVAGGTTPHQILIRKLILEDLSSAERGVLELMIGNDIGIKSANKTISNQKTSILKKLGLKNTNELIKLLG